jgi:hypothetical protein
MTQVSNIPVLTENAFADSGSFEMAQRMALALSKSELIPKAYQGNIPSTMIALELSKRTGVSPIMVMQNLNVIQGKPSWSSSFIIAVINSYKKFTMPLNFELKGEGDNRSCVAFTTGTDGQRFESPEINIKMAVAEGWMGKPGSKWKTMPDLMLRYRAAAFFGRLYCPELLMGMQSEDEVVDVVGSVKVDPETFLIELKDLFELKKESISEDEIIFIERILKNKEVTSYQKLHSLLTSK